MIQSKINVGISNSFCAQHSGNQIIQIKVEEGCHGNERLMCHECIVNSRGLCFAMSISEARERVEDLKSQSQQQILSLVSLMNQMLAKMKEKTQSLQSKVYELISSLNSKFDQFQGELDSLVEQYNNCDLIKELDTLNKSPNFILKEQFLSDSNKIQQLNRSYSSKISNITLTLQTIIKDWDVQSEFDTIFNQISTQINNYKKQNDGQTQVQEIKQQKSCWAIAFNYSDSIMAAGCEENIKIWDFQDKKLVDSGIILEGHSDFVQCLTFSKRQNWLVSGGLDEKIICWNQVSLNKWQQNQVLYTGKRDIQNLILTPAEDQLILSHDSKIKLWNLNIEQNTISFKQSLEMHQSNVKFICVNNDSTFLISSAQDNKIILWSKQSPNNWSYQCTIDRIQKDCGNRICFISNSTFTYQSDNQGILHIFMIENGRLIEAPELKVRLQQQNKQDGTQLFPSIFNNKKMILIQKHNKSVYILKRDNTNTLRIYGEPIHFHSRFNYGTITNDGNFLVIWSYETKQFKIYQIN
ncbi:unnamed protein product (macronuclear) [Paramecium tetraurelia]|uniref:Uncharacterized protein n=1 Tax=Paramecium tetraurelia TaxID=5888 RepID=A0CGC8_PARTE|nr:uncharacterized protein GSPATT00007285001 [Paramecium tetraurelia]CAK69845.1 unnamed protein product [Paramecium tetraurelia]|eukprot:XP_001437242.1 hypothetical protein (macronuclear) [Paramecium tetraurelia strain d4-2]